MHEAPLLCGRKLVKEFTSRGGKVRAVDGVDFEVYTGETVGVVGESGSGKSTLARLLLRLEEPTAGSVSYRGEDLARLPARQLVARRRHFQMIFQDPYASLNPRLTVRRILHEPLQAHRLARQERELRIAELLDRVGIASSYLGRHAHELSGGQRQRIGIARALLLRPRVILADEPVSALDVSVQAQILNLLAELQQEFNLALVFIAHDLAVVKYVCRRIVVMQAGQVVETAPTERLFADPRHAYTRNLLASVPRAPRPTLARRLG